VLTFINKVLVSKEKKKYGFFFFLVLTSLESSLHFVKWFVQMLETAENHLAIRSSSLNQALQNSKDL